MAIDRAQNFIRDIIDEDLRIGRYQRVVTRFPPEPNGYPHIGHVKSICLNFGLARDYGGVCNLRMDDTNPTTEDVEYVEAMKRDIRWLGFDFDRVLYASDYFEQLYQYAVGLIERGLAYVDDASEEEIRSARGSLSEPGRPTRGRDRGAAENLELFARMRSGALPDGSHVLRARIDLAASNMKMRDPLLYRIRHAHHYRTGDAWCIYPMYDYAHPLSDAIEGITHSICTLEFENNRELYDWVVEKCETPAPRPRQIEMARLALGYTVMSKRKLLRLVGERRVDGWDDPRMPTISGMRRRGVPPEALRAFAELVGVAKTNSTVDIGKFWHCVHEEVNRTSPRVMAVERPLKVVLTDLPAPVALDAPSFPPDVGRPGSRRITLARELWIDGGDFATNPGPQERKLTPGGKARLRYGFVIRCDEVIAADDGSIAELRCSIEHGSLGRKTDDKNLAVLQWVPADGAVHATLRTYLIMFTDEKPDELEDFLAAFDPESKHVATGALIEPSVSLAAPGARFQLERKGYYVVDPDSSASTLVLNRTTVLGAEKPKARAVATERVKNTKAESRPKSLSPIEARAIARQRNPELAARHARLAAIAGVRPEHADVLTGSPLVAALAAAAVAAGPPAATATFLANVERLEERLAGDPATVGPAIGKLVAAIESGAITRAVAGQILDDVLTGGRDPAALIAERGLAKADDSAVAAAVDTALAACAAEVARYRAGEQKLFGFLLGQVMKQVGGKADPQTAQRLLRDRLA